ncbi:hypothetical protein Leryth_017682, partial [Lithospermum erythrorhizon]
GEENQPTMSKDNNKGGFRATFFIYGLTALDNMGFVANVASLLLYFMGVMHYDLPGAANTLTNFMGATFLLTMIGGFISDTYINRFLTCIIFGLIEIMALVLMTIQAYEDKLHPEPCLNKSICIQGKQAAMLYVSLCLLALGCGGVRGALPALGADQFNEKDPKEVKSLASYFNYLVLSVVLGSSIGVTFLVYLSTNPNNKEWWKGFLICTVATFVGFAILVAGKNFYRLQNPNKDSPLVSIAQVLVVAIKNRKLSIPDKPEELYEIHEKDLILGPKILHTEQFRCLDKAAIFQKDMQPARWKICTVTQIEEVKVVTRMLPIIASTIIMNTCLAQLQTFSVAQASRMDRFIGKFEVSAASIPAIPLIMMCILIPIYDILFVPFARKITKHPAGITQLQRVGVGLVLSALSMAMAAIIEVKRKNASLRNPLKPISVFWLSFQYGIFGIADMFTLVGLMEFFYKEAPMGMRSLSTSFTFISLSFGYFLSSIFVDSINVVTQKITPSKQGWLHGLDIDRNQLNLFYWFLAILSSLNFVNYLFWSYWYKYKSEDDDDKVLEAAAVKTDG